ncbi:hypothetical protein Barb4_01860 [Bacteroidales bacterium Barb4]|nr:hypothetical protein Barb4_01860 [Bacteroidales bacterium Barb4]
MIYKHIILGRPFRTSLMVSSLTPHSASLHVGLKSLAPSGHLRNISYLYSSELRVRFI